MSTNNDRKIDFKRFSNARLGLGHAGGQTRTMAWLDFQKDFAQAKDALSSRFDIADITRICDQFNLESMEVFSKANELAQFLARPDLGKQLSQASTCLLRDFVQENKTTQGKDVLIVISGGLSPDAIQQHIPALLPSFLLALQQSHLSIAPIIIVPRSRVAFGDELNEFFKAKITLMFIGERPGLTTSNSLGVYLTYAAKLGCTDEVRNCISNIHATGLDYPSAITKLLSLIHQSLVEKKSGVLLKEDGMGSRNLP